MTDQQLYSVKDAAEYLGLKPETIKHHLYISKRLIGQRVAGRVIFTKNELDDFQAQRAAGEVKPGPKPKE